MPDKISGNGGYTYPWTNPSFIHDGTDLYGTTVSNAGNQRVFINDATNSANYLTLETNASYDDDHNAPSLCINSDKDSLAFTTRHGADSVVKLYRKASNDTDKLNFVYEQDIEFSVIVSYSQPLCFEDRIVLFVRGGGNSWRYRVSEDRGVTWGEEVTFYQVEQTTYWQFRESPTTPGLYHAACAKNPASPTPHHIIYGTVNIDTGDITSNNTTLGNLFTPTALPLTKTDFYDIQPTVTSGLYCRLLDIGEKNGRAIILFCKWGDGLTSGYYKAVEDSAGSCTFTRSKLDDSAGNGFLTGDEFTPTSQTRHYIAGAALSRTENKFAVGYEASGNWNMKIYSFDSSFVTQAGPSIMTSGSDPRVRPMFVEGANTLIYQILITYNSYKDYLIEYWKN